MHDVFGFTWRVDSLGYRWIEAEEFLQRASDPSRTPRWEMDTPPFLTNRGNNSSTVLYEPMEEHRTLFREFAFVEQTKAGILSFASEYGLLGGDAPVYVDTRDPARIDVWAEPLSAWVAEITAFRILLDMWDSARAGNIFRLGDRILVTSPTIATIRWPATDARIITPQMESLIARTVGTKDLNRFAIEYVRESIRRRLQVLSFADMGQDDGNHRLPLSICPIGLLGLLWLQFARSLDGKDYRRCRQCGEWFEISRPAGRSTKQFCNGACRYKWHRETTTGTRTSAKPKPRRSTLIRDNDPRGVAASEHQHEWVPAAIPFYKIHRS
jgi:hypothetical protein